MLGWLVVKPLRHVEAFWELSVAEAAAFGPLLLHVSRALEAELHPLKVYVCLFAEAENAAHLHVHVIPRAEDLPVELRGPGVFELLRRGGAGCGVVADAGDVAALVARLRSRLS